MRYTTEYNKGVWSAVAEDGTVLKESASYFHVRFVAEAQGYIYKERVLDRNTRNP